jgi:hypothetical protein
MNCKLCGEPMPEGEEMFNYHGYSGPCPKPPLPKMKCTAVFTDCYGNEAHCLRDKHSEFDPHHVTETKPSWPSATKVRDSDSYVAFLRWTGATDDPRRHLQICNSDDPGAFKVYRNLGDEESEG